MSILSRLFGKKSEDAAASAGPSEEYKGFTITPAPQRDGGHYRIAARIDKGDRSHHLIRADTLQSLDDASAASTAKARQVIDEQGDRLFD